MEKKIKKKKWERKNDPSPVSYDVINTSPRTTQFERPKLYSMPKDKKTSFADKIIKSNKFKPGVGKYDPHLSLDKVYRPSMGKR